jgi:hypothetical protein
MIKNLKLLFASLMLFAICFIPVNAQQQEFTANGSPSLTVNLEGGVYHYLSGAGQHWVKVDLEDIYGVVQQTTYTNALGRFYFHDIFPNTPFMVRPDESYNYGGSSNYFSGGLPAGNYCCGKFYVITAR